MLLATCGTEPVVRLWAPEAEEAACLSSVQLATATLNMMEGDNLQPEDAAGDGGMADWAEMVSVGAWAHTHMHTQTHTCT